MPGPAIIIKSAAGFIQQADATLGVSVQPTSFDVGCPYYIKRQLLAILGVSAVAALLSITLYTLVPIQSPLLTRSRAPPNKRAGLFGNVLCAFPINPRIRHALPSR